MDIVTDLTSQAVSYLTLLQDICKDKWASEDDEIQPGSSLRLHEEIRQIEKDILSLVERGDTQNESIKLNKLGSRVKRMEEIIFYSSTVPYSVTALVKSFFDISENLVAWMNKPEIMGAPDPDEQITERLVLMISPDQGRRFFRSALFEHPSKRLELITVLHYMPIQVILCLGGSKLNSYDQRFYQVYSPNESHALLSHNEIEEIADWWNQFYLEKKRSEFAPTLLTDDAKLIEWLLKTKNAVSFESAFNTELTHINKSRLLRNNDTISTTVFKENIIKLTSEETSGPDDYIEIRDDQDKSLPKDGTADPIARAQDMHLTGLAFSGGGIRSATFNLGVLQKLAETGILGHMDYISTVSGGGYIGSWLISWIKRSGSISKVVDRLDKKQSGDPMADEVRPIRWLRMYSNYLAPNASIMSTDSWTMGITWLRNTLINQSILLLLLCTGLSLMENIFQMWTYLAKKNIDSDLWLNLGTICMLLLGSLLAGLGMHTFDREYPPRNLYNYGRKSWFSWLLVGWAVISAYLVSTWLYHSAGTETTFAHKLKVFIIPAIAGFAGILLIAFWGNYHRYKRIRKPLHAYLAIFLSSVLGILVGFLFLGGAWELFEKIHAPDLMGKYITGRPPQWLREADEKIGKTTLPFMIGTPLVLQALCWCVIVRMFMMGILFPDERREWWGRMGAIIHRFIAFWLLVTVCVFVLPCLVTWKNLGTLAGLAGGWAVIIGAAVRMAFTSTKSGENKDKSGMNVQEIFLRFAPYLFMLGFLLIGSYTLKLFQNLNVWTAIFTFFQNQLVKLNLGESIAGLASAITQIPQKEILGGLLNTLFIGLITVFLSWRAGVNEFSLHHFYRNRLVRAYLGATRRRTDRVKTANSFTGFDNADDHKLDDFTFKNNYYGPYPIINTALNATNVSELDRQDRKAESFIFTPLFCGFDFSATRSAAYARDGVFNYGYRRTKHFANGPTLGTAMAISGAAVNPNMGYHSSAATAFLLTIFNVRLGWWIGNPRTGAWQNPEPKLGLGYLIYDLVGSSTIDKDYVCLSDGGHFDNMGLYELVRRRCKLIILSDAEEDTGAICEGLANAIRRCRIDFGVEIEIDTKMITNQNARTGLGKAHVVKGEIKYPGHPGFKGKLVYIKSALTGDEPTDIREYKLKNPKFPQQSTADQFFDEEQFESYRKLGYHSIF